MKMVKMFFTIMVFALISMLSLSLYQKDPEPQKAKLLLIIPSLYGLFFISLLIAAIVALIRKTTILST